MSANDIRDIVNLQCAHLRSPATPSSKTPPDHAGAERTIIVNRRTRLQSRAFELLEINPDRTVPTNLTG